MTLFILAGNMQQADGWIRKNKEFLLPYTCKYLNSKSLNFYGNRDCFYVKVGTYYEAGYRDEIFVYFNTHNIKQINVNDITKTITT